MPATMAELGLDKWSVEDRKVLIEELQASVGWTEDDIPEWHLAILNERLDKYDQQPEPTEGRSLEEVFARLMKPQ